MGEVDAPNPEYPWEAKGMVRVPADEKFSDIDFASPQMLKLLIFIEICFELG